MRRIRETIPLLVLSSRKIVGSEPIMPSVEHAGHAAALYGYREAGGRIAETISRWQRILAARISGDYDLE